MMNQNFYDSPSSSGHGQKGRLPIFNGNDLTLANINNIYDEIQVQLGLEDQDEVELSPLWEYEDQDQGLPEETLINTPPPPVEGDGDIPCVDPLVQNGFQPQDPFVLVQDIMSGISVVPLHYDYGQALVPVPEVPAPQPHEQKPLIEKGKVLVKLAPVPLAPIPIAEVQQQVSGQIQVPDPGTSTGKGNRRRGRPKGSSNKKNRGSSSPTAPIQLSPRKLQPAPVPLQAAPVVTSSSIVPNQQSEPSSTTPKSKRLKKWQEAELTQENRNAKLAHQTRLRQQREKAETTARISKLEQDLAKAQSIQALQAARIQQLESQNSKLSNFAYRSAALCGPLAHKIWTYLHGRFPGRAEADDGTGSIIEVQLNPGILNYDPNIAVHARSQFTLGILEAEVLAGKEAVIFDAVPMSSILPPQNF